jgi:nicotinamidase/pyrazinamidase
LSSALLIVDLQNDFLPGGALPVPKGDEIIPLINEMQQAFPGLIVATKDWHGEDHVSFATQHGKKPGEIVEVNGLEQILWPVHCVQNSWGAEFAPALNREKIENVFYKGVDKMIDSYSAFFDNAKQRSTGLGEFLTSQEIKNLYIAGLATDYCVRYSALDARALGFETYIVIDACRGIDLIPGDCERAVADMREVGAQILRSSDFFRVTLNK